MVAVSPAFKDSKFDVIARLGAWVSMLSVVKVAAVPALPALSS